jgi:hypothetical protein
MPIGKKAVEAHMRGIIGPQLTPGETIITTLYCSRGINPLLWRWLNIIGALLVPHYYIALTNQRVIFQKMDVLANQPNGAMFSDPNASVTVTKIRRRFLWSSFRYSSPTFRKPIRLNLHRNRRNSMDEFTQFISNNQTAAQTATG